MTDEPPHGQQLHRRPLDVPHPWRIRTAERTITFATERGARTAAALRIARAGRLAVAVEHRDADGWHACPGAEELHDPAIPPPHQRPHTTGRARLPGRPDARSADLD